MSMSRPKGRAWSRSGPRALSRAPIRATGRRPSTLVFAVLATSAGSLLAACSGSPASTVLPPVPVQQSAHGVPSFYTPPNPLPAEPRGSLIRAERVTGVPLVPSGATVWRILYHSQSIYGADIAVSGYVVVPPGRPPAGGFPVISWAHGTTGFNDTCAPSLFNHLASAGGPSFDTGPVSAYLAAGFEIAATDYQGLGTPGPHPYLLGESEGRGVLDAARAAQHVPGAYASSTVLIYGHSQGGQSALFAGELAPTYAPDLHVIGVVAAAPATNLSSIVQNSISTSYSQSILLFTVPALLTWSETYNDLPASDAFTSSGATLARSLVDTGCLTQLAAAITSRHIAPQEIFSPGVDSNSVVASHAKLNDPGRTRTAAPVLVVQGTADTTVPAFLTDMYVQNMACPIGDTIDYLHVNGATHSTVLTEAQSPVLAWMLARVANMPAPSTCSDPGDVSPYLPARA
jgi:pimeloyl-ACP methyl ester carboxylesterase